MRRYGTPTWLKFTIWLIGIFVIWAVALVPEIVMCLLYKLVSPESDLTRVLTLAAFWLGGGGLCVVFFILGIMASLAWTAVASDL